MHGPDRGLVPLAGTGPVIKAVVFWLGLSDRDRSRLGGTWVVG